MTALVIDEARVGGLRAFAEAHPIALDDMRRIAAGIAPVVGDRAGHAIRLDFGFRVAFSIEEHPLRGGAGTAWVRHMSMSCDRPGRLPHPAALEEVGRLLGLPPLRECLVREDMAPGAIEVLADSPAPPPGPASADRPAGPATGGDGAGVPDD